MNILDNIVWINQRIIGLVIKKKDVYGDDQFYLVGSTNNFGVFTYTKQMSTSIGDFKTGNEVKLNASKETNNYAKGQHCRVVRLDHVPNHAMDVDDILSKAELKDLNIYEGHDIYTVETHNIEGTNNYHPLVRKGSIAMITPAYMDQDKNYLCEVCMHDNVAQSLVFIKDKENTFKLIGFVDKIIENRYFTKYQQTLDLSVVHFVDEVKGLIKEIEDKNIKVEDNYAYDEF